MEDWKTPLDEAETAIKKAKVAMAAGNVREMHEILHNIPETINKLVESLWAAMYEMD